MADYGVHGFQPTRPLRGATGAKTKDYLLKKFQPTRPLRGATVSGQFTREKSGFQPTRPLRGATAAHRRDLSRGRFQPTRPLRGATSSSVISRSSSLSFQPTRPLRGATLAKSTSWPRFDISTHAPLAGRDCHDLRLSVLAQPNFNPRAPCGARPSGQISRTREPYDFNPRAPCGARPLLLKSSSTATVFQPTRPLRGATADNAILSFCRVYFNPRAPCGARLWPVGL